MQKKLTSGIALLSLVVITTFAKAQEPEHEIAAKPTVQDILARYINAIGGREALEKLQNRFCTGKVITDFSSRQQPIYESLYLEAYASIPTNCYIETWSDGENRREGFDGEIGWVRDKCGVREKEEAVRSKLAFLLNPQGPLLVETYFPGLSYEGVSVVNGKEVHALKPASLPPAHYTLYFSAESGLLLTIGHYWTIEDYRKVDGVLLPHRISTSRKGGLTVYEFETITHNTELDNSLFTMPGESN